eukprot:gb/GFBE01001708.1/.p1 GENE.gb/GFBE01001708.1/~~gb/GFBE01001708.1/.p1  ORF type:complete len:147 (+),score=30.20 gb/GFBE01001708.1/:1-441(+)
MASPASRLAAALRRAPMFASQTAGRSLALRRPHCQLLSAPSHGFCSSSKDTGRGGGSSSSSSYNAEEELEKARKAQSVWNMMVPEQSWDWRSPMIPILLLSIVVLQYLITQKQSDARERELEEVRILKEERQARREAREAAAGTAE